MTPPYPLPNPAVDPYLLYEETLRAAVVNHIWCGWGLDETIAVK